MRLVRDRKLKRGVDLIVTLGGALMALDQHDARALLDHDKRAREQRSRLVAARRKDEMDRLLDRSVRRHMDQRAVPHERRIERYDRIISFNGLAEPPRQRVTLGERLRQR